MAINQNHPFEDLEGVKCAVVEKNASAGRMSFLKDLLELNGYTVIVAATPPPKSAPVADDAAPVEPPLTYTIGVTDVMFNSTNAVFGRVLRTADGHVVTLDYWHQRSPVAHDEVPYFSAKK